MPIYTFKCKGCGKEDEKFLSFSDFENIRTYKIVFECKVCGNIMKYKVSVGSFQFKGKGFYKTDY